MSQRFGNYWKSLKGEMATHSRMLPWRMPRTEEPGGLQSTRLQSQIQLSNWAHPTSSKSYLEARRAFPPKKPCCTCDVEGQLSQADLFGRANKERPSHQHNGLVGRADSPEKTPMLGKIEGRRRRRGRQRTRWLDGLTDSSTDTYTHDCV